ncbi:MAG: Myo-inositol 2-dehydrogenase [uncultured Chloroflexi bacterium]|uniref:Myo-inositol 2-dehydrogenase n=1 Tax=uncultured Chloroflexota bacterium TaxID=166587 RepID=A0A6J4K623_9CHLR|nr:MAG: Myo-inositol 2-dehydrogenase [uncultured Chloroflexota bacterium]
MEKVRFGIIGSGGIARGAHIPQLLSHGKAEIAWCADVSEATAKDAAARAGTADCGTDYVALLRERPVDAVTIGTPHNAHHAAVMAALEAGVHVCCEKPLAMNVAEAQEMAELARAKGVITFVPFSYWFVPAARLLKELIDQGHLGEILHVTGYYSQGNALTPNATMTWRFQKEIAGSGALGDLGSHLISLTYLWAGPVKRLTAQMKTFVHERKLPGSDEMGAVDVDDDVQLIGELASGGLINLSASRTYAGRNNYQRVEVSGREGGVVYDNSHPDELQVSLGRAWHERNAWATLPVGRQHRLTQLHTFVDAILEGKDPADVRPNFEVGLEVQKVMEAAQRSAESGAWVDV